MSDTRLYATTIAIQDRAVLLMGPSGSGKSDLALRLIDRGATLVSDDYTLLSPSDGMLLTAPPATIAGKIEVRGLGIVTVPYLSRLPATLVVQLGGPVERLPLKATSLTVSGIAVPEITLDAFEQSAPIKVELALLRVTEDL